MSDTGRDHHHRPDTERCRERSHHSNRRHHDNDDDRRRRRSASPPPRRDSRVALREIVNARRAVPLDQYRKDYKSGKYARMSGREKIAMFGSATAPIFVPLAPGESEDQYETRFRAWLRRLDRPLEQLRASSDLYQERRLRIEFTTANIMGYERFDQLDWDKKIRKSVAITDVVDTHTPLSVPSSNQMDGSERKATTPTISHKENDPRPIRGASKETNHASGRRQRDEKTTERTTQATPPCPSKLVRVTSEPTPAAPVESHLACGCTPCLFAVMRHMAQQVLEMEEAHATANGPARVVDLTDE